MLEDFLILQFTCPVFVNGQLSRGPQRQASSPRFLHSPSFPFLLPPSLPSDPFLSLSPLALPLSSCVLHKCEWRLGCASSFLSLPPSPSFPASLPSFLPHPSSLLQSFPPSLTSSLSPSFPSSLPLSLPPPLPPFFPPSLPPFHHSMLPSLLFSPCLVHTYVYISVPFWLDYLSCGPSAGSTSFLTFLPVDVITPCSITSLNWSTPVLCKAEILTDALIPGFSETSPGCVSWLWKETGPWL